jgi:RNA polymerase sigma-70 factor (ECF subfamily)
VEATAPAGPGGEPPPEGEDRSAVDPAAAAERGEIAGRVRAAVDGLPEDQRMAVLLSKYEGLSYRELADAMGRSVPAVKSLLVRARDNLRRTLSPILDLAPPAPEEEGSPAGPRRRRGPGGAARGGGAAEEAR